MKRINRKVLLGIVGAAMLVLTVGSLSASAQTPYGVPYGYAGYAGYGAYTTYFDPRYCGDGLIAVVPEKTNGAPINICATTGVRVFPVYSDFGGYGGYGGYGVGYGVPGAVPTGFAPYAYYPYVYR
jgi:hypothetical protein